MPEREKFIGGQPFIEYINSLGQKKARKFIKGAYGEDAGLTDEGRKLALSKEMMIGKDKIDEFENTIVPILAAML